MIGKLIIIFCIVLVIIAFYFFRIGFLFGVLQFAYNPVTITKVLNCEDIDLTKLLK